MKVPNVSEDGETPVVETYGIAARYRFTGSIRRVQIELGPMPAADTKQEEEASRQLHGRKALAD